MGGSSIIAFRTLGGAGPSCLLLHGFGSDRLSWLGTAPALQQVATVHALDLPGHGQSSLADGDAGPRGLAGEIASELRTRGLARLHIVGHSLGGAIGILLAAHHPDLVESLALIAPAGLGQRVDTNFLAAYPELAELEAATVIMRRLVVKPHLIGKQVVQRALTQLAQPGARENLRRVAAGLQAEEPGLFETALQIDVRRMVIWGAEDRINMPSTEKLKAFGGELHVIASAGHLLHIEDSKQVNHLLAEFLANAGK